MRTSGQTPTYACLSQLRGQVESAIESLAVHQAASDSTAVQAGELDPAQSLLSRLRGRFDANSGQESGKVLERALLSASHRSGRRSWWTWNVGPRKQRTSKFSGRSGNISRSPAKSGGLLSLGTDRGKLRGRESSGSRYVARYKFQYQSQLSARATAAIAGNCAGARSS